MSSKITSKLDSLNDSPFYLSADVDLEKQLFYFNLLKRKIYPKGMMFRNNYHDVLSILNIILNYLFDNYGITETTNNEIINNIIKFFNDINATYGSIEERLKIWKKYIQILIFNLQRVVILLVKSINDTKRLFINIIDKTNIKYEIDIIIGKQYFTIDELIIFLKNVLNLEFNKYIRNGVLKDDKYTDIILSASTNINLLYKHLYYKLITATEDIKQNKIYNFELYIFARLIIDKLNKLSKVGIKDLILNHNKSIEKFIEKNKTILNENIERSLRDNLIY